jgi:hypothetical protein
MSDGSIALVCEPELNPKAHTHGVYVPALPEPQP